jgi:hypothetical protein
VRVNQTKSGLLRRESLLIFARTQRRITPLYVKSACPLLYKWLLLSFLLKRLIVLLTITNAGGSRSPTNRSHFYMLLAQLISSNSTYFMLRKGACRQGYHWRISLMKWLDLCISVCRSGAQSVKQVVSNHQTNNSVLRSTAKEGCETNASIVYSSLWQ